MSAIDPNPPPDKLVIVSGRSGSGKSTALHVLEDAGFYCIDNLPVALLPGMLAEARSDNELTGIAVSIDARNMPGSLARFRAIMGELPPGLAIEILYLDADDATLIKRFSETRRRHPLSNPGTSLAEALAAERELLAPIAARASLTIDTSAMALHDLRDLVRKTVGGNTSKGMVVLFESFGYKRGVPVDADLVFDLRCLPNPHWDPRLRDLTGRDPEVIAFLEASPEVDWMLVDIGDFLERWLPCFADSNRSYTTIALGCTGGQHRSVYLSEQLFKRFRATWPGAQIRHRDLAVDTLRVIRREVTIVNRLGLHARAAAKLVSTASRFGSSVRIERDGRGADAKSIMAVMMLAATRGTLVTLAAEGADEAAAIDALSMLIADRFGEDE